MNQNILWIGLGKIGLPMAARLQQAGHAVIAFDKDTSRIALAKTEALHIADNLDTAIAASDIIISSLPHDRALEDIAAQVAAHAHKGALFIDTSTVSVAASQRVAALLSQQDIDYLRTAVSGNGEMAKTGMLTVLSSGPQACHDKALNLFSAIGKKVFYLGEAEQSRTMKLVVNLMIAQTSAMLGEALSLGRSGGLGWSDMWNVLTESAVASPIVKAKSEQLRERNFAPTFTVDQMLKDLDLILGEAALSHVPLLQTAMTRQLLQSAQALGLRDEDYAAVIKVIEHAAALDTNKVH